MIIKSQNLKILDLDEFVSAVARRGGSALVVEPLLEGSVLVASKAVPRVFQGWSNFAPPSGRTWYPAVHLLARSEETGISYQLLWQGHGVQLLLAALPLLVFTIITIDLSLGRLDSYGWPQWAVLSAITMLLGFFPAFLILRWYLACWRGLKVLLSALPT
jgi:hypothetical protein